jgi:hypothetical protein
MVKEGKLKRDKIKVRSAAGGLFDNYVVYANDVKYEDVLKFESEMISKPFESPLKEHHCYNKINPDKVVRHGKIGRPRKNREMVVVERPEPEVIHNSNVIDMQEYVKVNNQELAIKEFRGNRVVTFKEIDALHQRPDGSASRNFKEHRNRFIEGEDYFIITKSLKDEIRPLEIPNRGITVLTESGYLMIVKSFTDDLSWEVQRQLVKTYFRMKEITNKVENNLPVVPADIMQFKLMEMMFNEMKNQNQRLNDVEEFIKGIKQLAQ